MATYISSAEAGLYYLQSRYYNAEWGRFISKDDQSYHDGMDGAAANLYAYCENDPVNMTDPDGHDAFSVGVYGGWSLIELYEAIVAFGAADFWNPVGWVLLGIAAVATIAIAGTYAYQYYKNSRDASINAALGLMAFASTTATPPPPNKKGSKGTQVVSKTLYDKNGIHVDVENPGNRVGQIHIQQGSTKYLYNVAKEQFYTQSGQLAPKSIQNLLSNPDMIKAIAKGLQILGY